MPRIYIKKGTRTGEVDEDAMKSAMKEVLDKTLSIRKSAQKYGVKPSTLESRLAKFHKQETVNRENTQVRVFSSKFTSNQVYTDTPEKARLQEIENRKKFKKQEQERKERARKMKRALKLLSDENIITKTTRPKKILGKDKPKRQKKTDENETDYEGEIDYNDETDCEDEADMSLRESSCSPIEETSEEESDIENETPVLTENIKEQSFVLVKFEKKKTILYYVGQVLQKYSPIEYKVSFLRKKPQTWKFVFPVTKDEGTVYLADVVCLLSPSKSASTARTAQIFSFKKDLSMYNIG